tara:strand:- start:26047 stop:26235 length:189 start_codon:yes stop_codon:yes gene_type:complete
MVYNTKSDREMISEYLWWGVPFIVVFVVVWISKESSISGIFRGVIITMVINIIRIVIFKREG